MLEILAISISRLFYTVTNNVSGPLYPEQTAKIAELLEAYKNIQNPKKVTVNDYELLRKVKQSEGFEEKVHFSDYYLFDEEDSTLFN